MRACVCVCVCVCVRACVRACVRVCDVHYVCMLVQRFEPMGRRFTNFHYSNYYRVHSNSVSRNKINYELYLRFEIKDCKALPPLCLYASLSLFVSPSLSLSLFLRACVRACVRVCVCARMREREYVCVCVCVCVFV